MKTEIDASGNSISKSNILIEVDSYEFRMWNQYNEQTMFTLSRHAIGHSLGLGHSSDKLDIIHPQHEKDSGIASIIMDKKNELLIFEIIAAVLFTRNGA